ncbi:MAG: hypothetical protein JNJ54_33215 [Myxococcaceae bacterium]|nr:hypothetical protein [Myxococcaceae bacterium]
MSERDLDKVEAELFEAAKDERPTDATKARALDELLNDPPKGGAGARATSRWTWWVGLLSVMVAGVVGVRVLSTPPADVPSPPAVHDEPVERPLALPPPAPSAPVEPPPGVNLGVEPSEPVPAEPPRAPPAETVVKPPRPVPRAPAPEPEDELARELALLDEARRDVVGAPQRALVVLERHRRQFPRGSLATEAELLRLEALVHAGRRDEAKALGAKLAGRDGAGPLAERVNRLLEGVAP